MNFIISSTILQKNLQSISGVLTTNNAVPILDNFLFVIENNELIVKASDLETTMSVRLTLEKAEENGSFTIPAKMLLDTLKTFADVPLHFSINAETQTVVINAGEGNFKLAGHKGEDFPEIPQVEDTSSL